MLMVFLLIDLPYAIDFAGNSTGSGSSDEDIASSFVSVMNEFAANFSRYYDKIKQENEEKELVFYTFCFLFAS